MPVQPVCGVPLWHCLLAADPKDAAWPAEFFTFWPFFRKFLSNRPLAERIPEMDPWLGARVSGAELGATVTGAELLAMGKRPARGSAPERMAPSSAP